MKRYLVICFKISCLLFLGFILNNCASTAPHRAWGEDSGTGFSLEHIGKSALNAATAYETWLPLAGAGFIAVTNTDVKIQDWAARNTPVFGSTSNAKSYSDLFLNASTWIYITSAVVTPSGDPLPDCLLNKTKGFAVGFSAILSTQMLTEGLKTYTNRERPDGTDNKSFPSGHTSAVAVNNTLTMRNIEYLNLNPYIETPLNIALRTMTLATGWARVEGNKHYPTDVLFSAALGNFMGAFINDAFLAGYSADIQISANLLSEIRSFDLYIRF